MIRFLLNQQPVSESCLDPATSVLHYLRRRQGRTGTKEGCASGDCGACTVVLAEPDGQRLRYRSVNACITLMSALHGKQLLTVEDLKQGGQLHKVQQAMMDNHASQCGYCTPGIVMSLFALSKSGQPVDRPAIEQALGGNLCRCTGYRAIIDAASQCSDRSADSFSAQESGVLHQLQAMVLPDGGRAMTTASKSAAGQSGQSAQYLIPTSIDQLSQALLADPTAQLLAGGTDLALALTVQQRVLPPLIDISHIPALKQMYDRGNEVEIGAAASLSDCEAFIAHHFPHLTEMLGRFASRQIRNQATLGGNLANASPIGDCAPLLLALNARLRLHCGGQVREVPLHAFFIDYRKTCLRPGEFIESIVVPKVTSSHIYRAWKVSKRREDDISAVFGAFCLELDQGKVKSARLAYGGMAATPKRAAAAEAALVGQPWGAPAITKACQALNEDFTPMSDLRASSEYRLRVAQNLLRRFYFSATCPGQPMEIGHYV